MALRTILTEEDPVLHKKCHAVTAFDQKLHTLLEDMIETLIDSGGVGLAAPQIGILRRVVLVINQDNEIIELINPKIIETSGEQSGPEGCLSLPGKFGQVTRPMVVKVEGQDRYGNVFQAEGEELTARCFCHELDHLEGQLFTAHVTEMYETEDEDEEAEVEVEEKESPVRKRRRRRS